MNAAGDTLVINAIRNDQKAENAGAVYIYTRSGNVWTQQQKIIPYDGAANDSFGQFCIISKSSNLVFVSGSSLVDGHYTGAVYVYRRSGNTYIFERKLKNIINAMFFGNIILCFSKSEKLLVAGSVKAINSYDYCIHTFE